MANRDEDADSVLHGVAVVTAGALMGALIRAVGVVDGLSVGAVAVGGDSAQVADAAGERGLDLGEELPVAVPVLVEVLGDVVGQSWRNRGDLARDFGDLRAFPQPGDP